jgi:Ca2+-binding RTX toxin-like protein
MGTEGLTLPPGASAYLTSIGFTVSGEGSDNLEIMANDPGGVSPSVFEGILKTVLYHDNDTTFSFNPEDRSIAVTATDAAGGVSSAAHVHIDLAANVTDVNGPGALNHFTGANLADTVRGNDGNDTMEGRGGDDIIWGGTEGGDSGHDTAVFTGNQADYTVTRTGPGVYTVADSVANRDGTDTVHGVETLHFNGDPSDLVLDAPVLVFNASGNVLLASFQAGELDLAVNYANSHAGANIIELQSASGPFTAGTWPVDITEAVTIKAVGGTATVNAGSHSGFTIQPGAVSGAGDVVHFEGLSITGDGIAPDTVGVLFNGSYEGMSDGAIELVATSASGFGQDGVAIIGGGSGLTVTIDGDDPGVGGTQTATFTASGHNASSGGSGDLLFFNFTGSAALKNLSVIGTTGTVAGAADNGIQFAGFDGTDHSVDHAIGTVTFDQVTVSGTYEKTLVYVQGYDNYNGLSFANGLTLGGAGSQTSWTGLFIDGGPQGGAYVAGGTSTLNLTGVTVNGGTYGTSPSFAALGSKPIVVNGVVTGDIITGTNAAEAFIGSTGDDTINAGGGSDLVVYDTGDGHDTVDGEGGTDTLALINFTAGAPSATSATFTVAQSAGHLIVNTDGSAPAEVDALGMESLQVQLGNGGDTVTLTGNLAGAGISTGAGGIIIAGGTGSDTLDASALTSANAITFSNLGGGNDTFKAANVVANDVVNGAGGTGDTADYSVATQAVTIDLTAGTAVGASVGNDDIQNFENAMGGAGNDTLHGTNGANAFTGNGGVDTVTYAGLITAGMITTNGSGGWTVTSGSEGTDTLSTVEAVQGLNPAGTPTGKFLLVGNGGYASLEDAVAAALDGDTILLGTGTIALETTPNDGKVTIDKDITIIGRGAGFTTLLAATPIANAQSSSTAAMITVANGHTVNFSSFTVDGNDRMAGGVDVSTGILFDGGDGSITNMRFTNIGADVGDEPRGTGVVAWDGAQVTVTGSDFDQNERRGLAAFDTGTLVTITGSHFTAKTGQDEVGSFPGTLDYGVQVSDGAVVDISGSTFDNFSASENGFGSAGVLVAPVTGGSSTLNLNAGNTFTDNSSAVAVGFNPTDTDTVNFNNPVTVNSTVPGALGLQAFGDVVVTGVPANLTGDAVAVNWIGGPNANLMDGDDQSDFLQGNGDADTISGHGGDDTIVWNAGDGDDTIDGGNNGAPHSDTDTLQVAANGHNLTLTAGAGNFTITDGTSTATVSEVEEVNITLSGGETVTINGDFTGTGVNVNTFTIDGSAGSLGETVDARNLSSAHEVVFTGGSGDDTFYSGHGNDTFHGNAGNDIVNYTVEAGIDVLDGGGNSDTLNVFGTAGNDTIHVSINGSQAITSIEGMSPTSIEVHTADGLGGSGDTLDYSGSGANAVAVNLQTGSATGFATIANVENAIGTSGDDTFTGDANVNTFTGGAGSDVYNVLANDVVVEQPGGGTADEVRTTDSYTLGNEVENLTLQDKTGTHLTDTQIFDNMGLGPITDGEDGWTVNGPNAPRDQAVVDLGGGNYAFHMSSDPSVADFAGPFSPQLSAAAGEQATGAAFNGQSISFDFKAVNSTPDNSRLEIDFGNVAGTDRNNFMVIESIAGQGIRIAVNEPKLDGNFTTNDFTAFSGNITLASGVDASQSHHLELRLSYVDGQDNDIINVYLDGQYIGKTTTFENYHDALGGTHNANATANLTDRVFFRPSANGATQDGSGTGQNQGFNFDNLTTSVYNNTSGTGNGLANVIAGNSGDNLLTGLGGDDTLNGGLGIDTAAYQDVRSNYAISASTDSHGRVTGFSQVQETGPSGLVAEGTDALSGIERLQFADATLDLTQKVQLFHGGNLVGTFNTIQAAINTGVDGDTISLAAGTYNEAVNLNKDVTILGANSGTSGTSGGRGAESVLTGGVHITAAGVTIDGVKIDGNGNFAPDVTDPAAVYISANAATITNSVLQGDDNLDGYGVITNGGLTGLQITDNQFSGYGVATYIVAGTAGSITGNLFDDTNGNAVNTESQSTIVTGNTIEQTIGGEIQVLSADQTVDASAFVYGNTYTGLHAHPVQIYPNYTGGAAVITGTELGDTLNGDLVFPASPGPFTFHGLGGNDSAYGSALGDTFDGGAGNDDLEGNNGKDTANYDDVVSNYMVVTHSDANGFVDGFVSVAETAVNTGAIDEGTDTLSGIEVLQFSGTTFDLTKAVQVFHGGNLVGTFDVIQDGVNAAVAGDTVLINGAIDSSFNESVTVSAGITLKGIGSVTINGGASSALTIANGGAVQSLVIDNIDLVANSSGTPNHVVSVANTAQYASVTLKNGNVSGGAYAGFFLNNATGVAGVTIQNAQFSGAALVNSGSSGESEIYFYHYNGNVTLSGVSVTNPGLTGLEYGIQMVGQSPAAPMGTVSFSNVTVNGTYVKAGVAADTFSSANLSFLDPDAGGPLSGLTVNVSAGFAGINFDNIGGTIDLSGQPVSATNSNPSPTAFDIDLQGTSGSENFHGTNNDNFFNGKAGADILTGGSGNDVFFHVIGDGADTISGGGQTTADVLLVAGQGGFTGPLSGASETVSVQLNGLSQITSIDTASVAGVELVALDMGGGTDTLDYTGNSVAVTVNLAAGTAPGFSNIAPAVPTAIAGVENVIGGSNADTLTGSSVANALSGGGGNDTMTGGAGSDTLYGGTDGADSGNADIGVFAGNLSAYHVAFDPFAAPGVAGIDATVDDGAGNVDATHGVELLQFDNTTLDLTKNVLLYTGNDLIGTFDTIQAAVTAAHASGDTIKLKALTYSENVTITSKQLTIDGVDDSGPSATTIAGQITVDGTLNGALIVKDVKIDATGQQYGVFVSANSPMNTGSLTLDNVTIQNAAQDGLAYVRTGNGTTPTLTDTIGAVTIQHSEFSNNASNTTGGGRGDILLFGFNGNLTIDDVSIHDPAAGAQKAIQMRGSQDGSDITNVGPFDPAGNVAINDLTITGAYGQDAMAFYRLASFASFTGTGNNVNVTRSPTANTNAGLEPWAVINFDEVGGTINLAGFFVSASNLASPDGIVPAVPSVIATPQGLSTPDNFTGTSGMDVLDGRGGADTIHAGAGDDTITYTAGSGPDTLIDGGADSDTLAIGGTAANDTITVVLNGANQIVSLDTGTVTSVESATINLAGGAGDTLSYAGTSVGVTVNLSGTQSAAGFTTAAGIENVTGGAGIDTLTGSSGNNVINGGGGNDIIVGGLGDDTLSGGTGDDTFTYTVGDGIDTVDGGAGVEVDGDEQIVNGTGATETFNINPISSGYLGINIHAGASDAATDANYEVRTIDVEEIVINTNGGGDSVIISGDLGSTGVATSTITVNGDAGNNTLNASGVTGPSPVGVAFHGNGGDDTLFGGAGDDILDGGADNDTAVIGGSAGASTVTYTTDGNGFVTGFSQVTGPGGTDTLTDIEHLAFDNGYPNNPAAWTTLDPTKAVQLYDHSGQLIGTFDHIQQAVGAADGSGETIKIRNGIYTEQVHVGAGKDGLHIVGQSEAGVIVKAPAGMQSFANDANSPFGLRPLFSIVTVNGSLNVNIENLSINGDEQGNQSQIGIGIGGVAGDFDGIAYVNASGTVDHVTIDKIRDPLVNATTLSGTQRGNDLVVSNTIGAPHDFTLSNSTLEGFQKTGAVIRNAHVTLDNNDVIGFGVQTIIAQNGIQLSSGSTGSVTNNDISALGFTGANTVVGLLVFNGNGLAISDNHYVGTSTSDAGMWLIDSNGSTIQHNTLDTADYGILNTGVMTTEPTVVNQGLNANSYTNIEFTNDDLELIPATQTTAIHPVGSDGADFYTGGAGADVIDGRGGGDYIVGNAGADTLTGGLGTDVVDYSAETGPNAVVVNLSATAYAGIAALHATDTFGATDTLSGIENIAANVTRYGDTIALDGDLDFDWTLTFTGGPEAHWTATGINAHAGETHEFRGVEKIVFQCSGPAFAETVHLVDQNQAGSAYLSIQDAIDHASAGDTILLAAGTYTPTAALNIDKNVTILGANHGKDGTDLTRGAETVIDGTGLARVIDLGDHAINVAINGVSINGDHIFDEGTPDQTLAITDSVFSLTTNAANSFYFGYGGGYDFTFANNAVTATGYNEMFELFEGGSVHLKDNHFTGVAGVYTGDDNNVPLVFNLNKATGEVQGNTFDHVDIGVLVADAAGPLDITGNTFENMHRVGPNTAGGLAAGVVFFSPDPFNGLINVSNNTFTNADAGIRTSSFGAPATTVAGSLITINGNQFTDVGFIGYQPVGGVLHFTNSTLNPGPITVPSEFFGGTSDDMITSTAANDIVHGNDGIDTLVLSGNQSDYTIAFDGTTVTVTDNRVDVHDAIDTADHIGRLDFADHDVFLVGSGSDYTTVQSAVTAAGASDTVLLAAGTYSENVVVDKALTILGANHGVAGYASRGAESIIDGGFRLTASDVTLDGLNIINGRADFGQQRAAVFIDGARANITVENSILNETAAVHSESTQAAILTTYNANTSNLQVLHNVVENWGTAMYLNPGVHDSTFDDNTFADNGNHFIIDGLDDLTITNNDFGASGGSKIFANVYDNPTDLEIELGLSGNTFTPDHPRLSVAPYGAAGQVVLGTSGDDNLRGDFGAAVAQTLDGRAGNDLLVGDAGNDILIGGAGDDILTGGAHDVVNALTGVGGDTANYSSSSVGLNIALTSGGASNVADGLGGLDTLTGIENLIGGSAGDTLTGDGSNNVLIGNGGANILNGLGGDDRLAGGDVHDVLNGGSGNDVLIGGGGSDTLSGGDDADRFVYNLQSDAGTAVNAGEDQIFGFSHAQGDTFAFKSSFFTANENLVLDDGTGHVKADGLLITDVTDTSYSGFTGQPLFVLDTVVGGSAGTLWFDANGNGSLTDTNDVKIATFDNATSLAGINAHDLLLV